MDAIPNELRIDTRLAERAVNGPAPGELDRDAFLQLLISQLENQDPLSPMQDHEFVAQLATFSSLEQLETMNANLQASLLVDQSVNNSLATSLIGKEVLADGSAIRLGSEGTPSFEVDLASAADVTVLVRDARGDVVKRLTPGPLSEGVNTVAWDGTTDSGERADAGDYRIEVLANDPDGNSVTSTVRVRAVVTGIRFEAGTGYLIVGGQEVALANVLEVLAPSEG
jgi:flagellar basal-body rod modification protein FlgD